MLLPLALQLAGALGVARPTAVFTEWTLVDRAPRVEHVIARADYRRADGAIALLPRVLRRGSRPTAHVAGTGARLEVVARPEGWCVALPPGDRPELRVVASITRPIARPRAFRTTWPRFVAEGVPTRQLVLLPRSFDGRIPDGWTCPREPIDETPCVTRLARPSPFLLQLPALPSPPFTRPLATAVIALALALAWGRAAGRLERFACAAAGATVGFALSLALVGASVTGWGPALCWAVPVLVGVGVLAGRAPIGRVAGSIGLAVVPMAAVTRAPVEWVVGLTAVLAAAVLAAQRSTVSSSGGTRGATT